MILLKLAQKLSACSLEGKKSGKEEMHDALLVNTLAYYSTTEYFGNHIVRYEQLQHSLRPPTPHPKKNYHGRILTS